jgi:2-polyprenyl-3-methyl-5-hydroxy-6-metoxy-1,4-benzoquinol methylase
LDNTKKIFNDAAKIYFEKYGDLNNYNSSFDLFCDSLDKENAAILELACGPGNITKYLLKKRPDFKILGTDFAPKMIEIAKRENPKADFQVMDLKELKNLPLKFDGILCGFGLPYLSKEEAIQFIHDSKTQLNQNGLLYISTMEDDYSKSGIETGSTGEGMMMHYYEKEYLLQTLKQEGFTILLCQNQKFEEGEYRMTDLIIIAKISS